MATIREECLERIAAIQKDPFEYSNLAFYLSRAACEAIQNHTSTPIYNGWLNKWAQGHSPADVIDVLERTAADAD